MAYQYITNIDSPNFTPASEAVYVWGRPRTIEAIAIHWWGDPNTNPTFEGVISTLCNPSRGASAHFVATGTGRRVACLVNLQDASWATNSANPYTISIECDPRCRSEDYDVVGELIAELRREYGNLPLVPHRQFSATACPGNYDLARLDAVAASKNAGAEFGTSTNKNAPPATKPVTLPVPAAVKLPAPLELQARLDTVSVWDLATNPDYKAVKTLNKGEAFRAFGRIDFNGNVYYQTEYSFTKGNTWAVNAGDLEPVDVQTPQPELPKPTPEQPDRIGALEARVAEVEGLLAKVVAFITGVFKNFNK